VRKTFPEFNRLISFASVFQAIKAENLLAGAKIECLSIPTPREISISCGQCLIYKGEDHEAVMVILNHDNVRWSKLYSRDSVNRVYEKLSEFEG
jgi:hypothetical protein